MKKTLILTIIMLFGLSLACSAEEWYAAKEGSSYDYVSSAGLLLSTNEYTGSEYVPDYTYNELQNAQNIIKGGTVDNGELKDAGNELSCHVTVDPGIIPATQGAPPRQPENDTGS